MVHTPLTYGLLRPVILLPAAQNMGDQITDEELHLIFLHEWNHIRHLDVLWQWLLVILCSVHWFNPAVWVMYLLCRQDLELFCDAATAQQLEPEQNRSYAMLLLKQAAKVKRSVPVFSSSRFTGYQRMEERIQTIMKPKKFTWKLAIATAVLLCVGGTVFATTALGDTNGIRVWLQADLPTNSPEQENMKETATVPKNENESLAWPVTSDDAELTMLYGVRQHPITGEEMTIDHISIGGAEAEGSDIIAAAAGIVKEAGYDTQRGNYLIIEHDNGLETQSWHCEKLLVEEGDTVSAYQTIATLGRTGDATGPCLSFAVYQDGTATDPMEWIEEPQLVPVEQN